MRRPPNGYPSLLTLGRVLAFRCCGSRLFFSIVLSSHWILQNRYSPMVYLFWLLACWCSILSPRLQEGIDYCLPNHSDIHSELSTEGEPHSSKYHIESSLTKGVRRSLCCRRTNQIEPPDFILVLTFTLDRCDNTSWIPLLAFVLSTFLAQVVLTIRWDFSRR